ECIDPYTSTARCARFLAPGTFATCTRKGDGSLWCWCVNGGDGTWTMDRAPTRFVALGTSVAHAALGNNHGCAILQDRTLSCFGAGALGNGTYPTFQPPAQVMGLDSVT